MEIQESAGVMKTVTTNGSGHVQEVVRQAHT